MLECIVPASMSRRPEVIVEFLFERGLLFIAVRNIGDRPALGIAIGFDAPLRGLGGARDVAEQALFTHLEFLGPGREIVTFLDSSHSWFCRGEATRVEVRVAYADPEARRYEATIRHDLAIYRDLVFLTPPATLQADQER